MWNQYKQDVQAALDAVSGDKVQEAIELLRRAKFHSSNVWLVGNGGSAATASHFANDLLKMGGLHAIALPDILPTITAYGNDTGWGNMFSAPLLRLLLPQDVLIAISCSGNSPNVVEAVKLMRSHRLPALRTMVLTGSNFDCELTKLQPDVIIHVPFHDIRVQEDVHLAVCHAIAGALAGDVG